jgi:hypothetical protein
MLVLVLVFGSEEGDLDRIRADWKFNQELIVLKERSFV